MNAVGQAAVPKLRFPEFEGAWEGKRLGDVFLYRNGRANEDKIVSEGKYNLITLNSIGIDGRLKDQHLKVEAAEWFLQAGDLVMVLSDVAHGNFLGLVDIIPADTTYVLNQRMGLLRKDSPFILTAFVRTYINHNQKYFKLHGQGSSQQNLSKGDILKFVLLAPSLSEQKKIAAFLGAVDGKLAALREKEAALTRFKTGLMQALFSQTLRFTRDNDDGPRATGSSAGPNAYPDWEEKRLGEVAQFFRGTGLPKAMIGEVGRYSCIHYGELFTRYSEVIQSVHSRTNEDDGFLSKAGDVLMPSSDVTPDGLGRASSLPISDVRLGGDINIIRPDDSVRTSFLSFAIAFNRKQFIRRVTGTTVKHLYRKDLASIELKIPHPEEQQKIADALSAMDAKIAAVGAQVDRLNAFKKGLLQQMFV